MLLGMLSMQVTMTHPGSYASLAALKLRGAPGDEHSEPSFGQTDAPHAQDIRLGQFTPLSLSTVRQSSLNTAEAFEFFMI